METKITDTSFIIIAGNEQFAIKKCLESIEKLTLGNCEIICVCANSTDNTSEIIKDFASRRNDVIGFSVRGRSTGIRSIARNIGFKASKKEHIFFIDGDVAINEEFVIKALENLRIYACCTGDLEENLYNENFSKIKCKVERRYKIVKPVEVPFTGGIFCINRYALESVGLFHEGMRCEDLEQTLRLTRNGFKILQIPEIMGTHHTIDLSDSTRIKNFIKIQHGIYRGMIIRENLFHRKGLFSFFKKESSFFWGIPYYFMMLALLLLFGYKSLIVSILLFFTDMVYGFIKKKDMFSIIYKHYIAPLFIIKGFFQRLPTPEKYNVKKISESIFYTK